jgi:hypothetical protein
MRWNGSGGGCRNDRAIEDTGATASGGGTVAREVDVEDGAVR